MSELQRYKDALAMTDRRVNRLRTIIRELLALEEMDIGDRSQLPDDHPIAKAEAELGD